MLRFLFWITALIVTGTWMKELWQERKEPREEMKNPLPGKKADDHGEAAKQFPESFYEKQEDLLWRIDAVLILLMLLGAIIPSVIG